MARIKISSAKEKARWLQKWVAERVAGLFGVPWGPDTAVSSRGMGQSGPDVCLVGEIRKLFPYSVECKNGSSINWKDGVRQARKALEKEKDFRHWLFFIKVPDFQKPVVFMDAEEFFHIYKGYHYGLAGITKAFLVSNLIQEEVEDMEEEVKQLPCNQTITKRVRTG